MQKRMPETGDKRGKMLFTAPTVYIDIIVIMQYNYISAVYTSQ